MANKRMLVDATHPEETRIVVTDGSKLEEFDFESASRRQLRGNIYLAKVTRVEPSLQAAFVDYGGNRHGFLAFSEIHPDYYQIPVADREALLAAQAQEAADQSEDEEEDAASADKDADASSDEKDADASEAKASEDETALAEQDEEKKTKKPRRRRSRKKAAEKTEATETEAETPDAQLESRTPSDDAEGDQDADAKTEGTNDSSDDDSDDDSGTDKTIAANDGLEEDETDSVEQPVGADQDTDQDAAQDADDASAEPPEEDQSAELAALDGATLEDVESASETSEDSPADEGEDKPSKSRSRRSGRSRSRSRGAKKTKQDAEAHEDDDSDDSDGVETVGGDESNANDELEEARKRLIKRYKIQEVIKRRQVMLVQVVKEERGNKGAALTTYLSLAGRYSVLMPNTARGGGISRKITSAADRKRLKAVANELDVPTGMGVILRTAGATRTKAEIKRDFEYLSRVWEDVRERTMASTAPDLVYAEGSLIKRTIRDLYDKDISEVLVAGEQGHAEAKDFMKLIMPSHAKRVNLYEGDQQLFVKHGVEQQLDAMFSPQVTLPSGGYIVINPTEALVSIDVNSGRATKEHNIEDTALQTNLEAAKEVARQLRLRDMAGLVVIDFIDMSERKSIRAVEKQLKDALKNDRARIQIGRISHFGLLEMSRQRMRFGLLESSTHVCPTCQGAGIVRSVESLALMVMRAIEERVGKRPGESINVRTDADIALYLLNSKRETLSTLEQRYDCKIVLSADATIQNAHFAIDKLADQNDGPKNRGANQQDRNSRSQRAHDDGDGNERGSKRRRRRGRNQDETNQEATSDEDNQSEADSSEEHDLASDDDQPKKRRRRGRRGGRRNRRGNDQDQNDVNASEVNAASDGEASEGDADTSTTEQAPVEEAQPPQDTSSEADATEEKPKRRSRKRKSDKTAETATESAPESDSAASPAPADNADVAPASEPDASADDEAATAERKKKDLPPEGEIITSSSDAEAKPKKRLGWWSRKK